MSALVVRPFRLLGEGAVRAVRTALMQAVSAWTADWGLAPALVDVDVHRAWDDASARTLAWNHGAQSNGRRAWLAVGPDVATGLQQMIFPADPSYGPVGSATPTLAAAGALQALDALLDALLRTSLSSQHNVPRCDAAVPATPWEYGSGALVARLAVGNRHFHVLLDGPAVQALVPPAAPLPALRAVDVAAGVADVPVSLRLQAGTARVGVGALLSLAPGDVIRLDKQADAPLTLASMSSHPLFHAYLGRCRDEVAVELVQSHTPVGEVQ